MQNDTRKIKRKKACTVKGFGYNYEVIFDFEEELFKVYKLFSAYDRNGYPTKHRKMVNVTDDFREAVQMIANAM